MNRSLCLALCLALMSLSMPALAEDGSDTGELVCGLWYSDLAFDIVEDDAQADETSWDWTSLTTWLNANSEAAPEDVQDAFNTLLREAGVTDAQAAEIQAMLTDYAKGRGIAPAVMTRLAVGVLVHVNADGDLSSEIPGAVIKEALASWFTENHIDTEADAEAALESMAQFLAEISTAAE